MPRSAALMELPKCPVHGSSMHYRPARSYEQRFCGAWYDCDTPGCHCSVLIPSVELSASLETQRENAERRASHAVSRLRQRRSV